MYKPDTTKQLINDSTKLLLSLEPSLNVDDGFELLFVIEDLLRIVPNVNIHDNISGEQYQQFIKYICEKENLKVTEKLPYTRFNIRSGVYSSIVGMMAEYISLKTTNELFNNGKLTQDRIDQMNGIDIIYEQNGNEITADVKLSNTSWTNEELIYAHMDWFDRKKQSVRFHLVDIANNTHFIVGRSYLHLLCEQNGNRIPARLVDKYYHCKRTDIRHITSAFLGN